MNQTGYEIAITGMSLRVPGADSAKAFFENLLAGQMSLKRIPHDGTEGCVPVIAEPDDALGFDPQFFSLTRNEALKMDPQHRYFLMCCYEALDDFGYFGGSKPRVGIFGGAGFNSYLLESKRFPSMHSNYIQDIILMDKDHLCTRVAHTLGLNGPAVTIQTACSTSLSAVHVACQSLLAGECEIALAGGVSLRFPMSVPYRYEEGSILSPDGDCRPFDHSANGTVFGSGIGVVALQPLHKALEQGVPIYAIIHSSAMNNDGDRKASYAAPSVDMQSEVIRDAIEIGQVDPSKIAYIEAHGTGTKIGDPIEFLALKEALDAAPGSRTCALGSVKANVGHLEHASGVIGLIKAALVLHRGIIPGQINFETINPAIDLASSPFYIPVTNQTLDTQEREVFAGVTSLGAGGTNVHVILKRHQDEPAAQKDDGPQVLFVSARSQNSLALRHAQLARFIEGSEEQLADICHTLACCKEHGSFRKAYVVRSKAEAVDQLKRYDGQQRDAVKAAKGPVFVFSGQGSQWISMGMDLYQSDPVFKEAFDQCNAIIQKRSGWSAVDLIQSHGSPSINDVDKLQPCIVATQIAITKALKAYGIQARAVIGHSLGEITAAYVCGALTLDACLTLACLRSQVCAEIRSEGAVLLANISDEEAQSFELSSAGKVSIAGYNDHNTVVLSGDASLIQSIQEQLTSRDRFTRLVNMGYASHSRAVEEIESQFREGAAKIDGMAPQLDWFSTTINGLMKVSPGVDFWFQNLRQPVYFKQQISEAVRSGYGAFVEVSPHPVVLPSIRKILNHLQAQAHAFMTLKRDVAGEICLKTTLAQAYEAGFQADYAMVAPGRILRVPPYPWDLQRYFWEASSGTPGKGTTTQPQSLFPLAVTPADAHGVYLQTELSLETDAYIRDHYIRRSYLAPGSYFVSLGLSAVLGQGGEKASLRNLSFSRALALEEGQTYDVQLKMDFSARSLKIFSRLQGTDDRWREHFSCQYEREEFSAHTPYGLGSLSDLSPMDTEALYAGFASRGLQFGPSFRGIKSLESNGTRSSAVIQEVSDASPYLIHPATLDNLFQTLPAIDCLQPGDDRAYIPMGVDRISFRLRPQAGTYATQALCLMKNAETLSGNLAMSSGPGDEFIRIEGFRYKLVKNNKHDMTTRFVTQSIPFEGAKVNQSLALLVDASLQADRDFHGAFPKARFPSARDFEQQIEKEMDSHALGRSAHDLLTFALSLTQLAGGIDARDCSELIAKLIIRTRNILEIVSSRKIRTRLLFILDSRETGVNEAMRGFLRVASNEYMGLSLTSIMLFDEDQPATRSHLIHVLSTDFDEDELEIKASGVSVSRLKASHRAPADEGGTKQFLASGVHLVTGGLGSIGLMLMNWLIQNGAESVALLGRSAPSAEAAAWIEKARQAGTNIRLYQGDLGDAGFVANMIADLGSLGTLTGIFHAAGVLEDQSIPHLKDDAVARVLRPKVLGAINLHEATKGLDLKYFVLFSSVASIFGSKGQGAYAAANQFMAGLNRRRRSQGQASLCIHFGPWKSGGMANSSETIKMQIQNQGLAQLDHEHYFSELASLLNAGESEACLMDFDAKAVRPHAFAGRRSHLKGMIAKPETQAVDTHSIVEALTRAPDFTARKRLVVECLQQVLKSILGPNMNSIDKSQTFHDIGIDSIGAIELRDQLESQLKTRLSAALIYNYPTVEQLSGHILDRLGYRNEKAEAMDTGESVSKAVALLKKFKAQAEAANASQA